jgi:phytoene dehydrogenase-like protein
MAREFSRRDLLTSLLAIPLVGGCQGEFDATSQASLDGIDGSIVGPSLELGHRLRNHNAFDLSADRFRDIGVVIVGGGIAGLAAAWRLKRSGYNDFVLLELEGSPGGTARSDRSPVVAYPWGAHYLPAPTQENPELVKLLDELGVLEGVDRHGEPLIAEQFLCREPEERIFYKGRWYEGLYLYAGASDEDLRQWQVLGQEIDRWVAWRDTSGRRAFALPMRTGTNDAEVMRLDAMTMGDWLAERGLTSARLRWMVDYGCRDDYGLRVEQTSAWAGLFYFVSRIARPGEESRPLITWPEGNGRIVNHLHNAVKSHVATGWAAADVNPVSTADGPRVEIIALGTNEGELRGYRAKRVIFAAPQFVARHVVRPYRDDPPDHLGDFQYGSWLVANVHLKGRPREPDYPLCWDNVFYESPSLGYVVATHQRGLDHGPTIFTYYYPFCDDDPPAARAKLLAMNWRDCATLVLADMARAHPDIAPMIKRIDVMRWGHAMIRPTPGFIWSASRGAARQPFRGIHFANTDLSGIALFEEAYDHGRRAADEILESGISFVQP